MLLLITLSYAGLVLIPGYKFQAATHAPRPYEGEWTFTNKKISKLMLNQTHFIQQHMTNFDCISQSTKQKIIILKGYTAPMP